MNLEGDAVTLVAMQLEPNEPVDVAEPATLSVVVGMIEDQSSLAKEQANIVENAISGLEVDAASVGNTGSDLYGRLLNILGSLQTANGCLDRLRDTLLT